MWATASLFITSCVNLMHPAVSSTEMHINHRTNQSANTPEYLSFIECAGQHGEDEGVWEFLHPHPQETEN